MVAITAVRRYVLRPIQRVLDRAVDAYQWRKKRVALVRRDSFLYK